MERRVIERRPPRRGSVHLSQDPTDVLIRDLIQTGRDATAEEIDQITKRMAGARFPSLNAHLVKHVDDEQWVTGTTEQEYLSDLQRAIQDESARLAVYKRRGGNLASVLAETERIVDERRRGLDWEPLLFVAYSADRGIIVTGYQASSLSRITLPEDVRWLK